MTPFYHFYYWEVAVIPERQLENGGDCKTWVGGVSQSGGLMQGSLRNLRPEEVNIQWVDSFCKKQLPNQQEYLVHPGPQAWVVFLQQILLQMTLPPNIQENTQVMHHYIQEEEVSRHSHSNSNDC